MEPFRLDRVTDRISWGFPLTELSKLPLPMRAQRYLDLATDARRQAAMTKGALRESYLLMVQQWERLASELAATLDTDSRPN
jgi:hypothetical protein